MAALAAGLAVAGAAGGCGGRREAGEPPAASQAESPDDEEPHEATTNRLANQTSPYLLQHAHNPVDWHPWGKEAFARARAEDKPVFVSIGYSTCYWCHVMETDSFERADVADVLNKHFIAIKVDREERPDIDEQLMLATQIMTGQGGWPNSVWLTPDGRPWMAGTFFPRQQFIELLEQLAAVWRTRRADVEQQADQLAEAIRRFGRTGGVPAGSAGRDPLRRVRRPSGHDEAWPSKLIDRAVAELAGSYDWDHGGFGGRPKFPPHAALALLIHEQRRSARDRIASMIAGTLDAMAAGGVRDHLGGGFHRYSTDEHWLVPHFEKMLYDNAQLMRAYADGFLLIGRDEYRDVVAGIFAWLAREMTDAGGGFYSAIDAGAVGQEGRFYLWRYDQIVEALGETDGPLFAEAYGATREGNYREEATGRATGENILHLPGGTRFVGSGGGVPATTKRGPPGAADLAAMRDKLLAERNRRSHPHTDDKVLAGWNGLMIGSLAYAGRTLGEPRYTQAAARAAEFVLDRMTDGDRLLRSYRAGQAKLPGYLDDYAYLAGGLADLYEATGERRWLDRAVRLAQTMGEQFEDRDAGGFFFTSVDHGSLLMRSKNLTGGGNTPSPNAAAAIALLRLGRLADRPDFTRSGRRTADALARLMARSPGATADLALAAAACLEPVVGPTTQPGQAARTGGREPRAAGPPEPDVRWAGRPVSAELFASRLAARPGQTFRVAVAVQIADGWHVYGPNPGVESLAATTVSLRPDSTASGGRAVVPEPERLDDPAAGRPLAVYRGRVWFVLPVTIRPDAAPGPRTLTFELRTQACDDRRCLAPQTATLELEIAVDPAATDASRHKEVFSSFPAPPGQ